MDCLLKYLNYFLINISAILPAALGKDTSKDTEVDGEEDKEEEEEDSGDADDDDLKCAKECPVK